MSTEADRSLMGNLDVVCQLVGAEAGAVFTIDGEALRLRQSQGLDQEDLDAARGAFAARRGQLEQGAPIEIGMRTLWPVTADGDLEGVLYFDAPSPHSRLLSALERVVELIGRWLREQRFDIDPAAPQLARYNPEEALRQQLVAALLRNGGNISATAASLGVTRQTVYSRAERLGVDLARYRVRMRRRLA